jgi:hypothetical protein
MSLVTALVRMHTVIINSVSKELVGSRSSLFVRIILLFALFCVVRIIYRLYYFFRSHYFVARCMEHFLSFAIFCRLLYGTLFL